MQKLYQWVLRHLKHSRQNNHFCCDYDPSAFGEVYASSSFLTGVCKKIRLTSKVSWKLKGGLDGENRTH